MKKEEKNILFLNLEMSNEYNSGLVYRKGS